eukprot:2855428-Pleurochrysis_carterae.AAC.7
MRSSLVSRVAWCACPGKQKILTFSACLFELPVRPSFSLHQIGIMLAMQTQMSNVENCDVLSAMRSSLM